jgi:hypothetical protein
LKLGVVHRESIASPARAEPLLAAVPDAVAPRTNWCGPILSVCDGRSERRRRRGRG